MVTRVRLSRRAQKDLMTVPRHVAIKLGAWVDDVTVRGLGEVRKVPGYHDEPLKGRRAGQRSIRLSRAYRAIYEVRVDDVTFVSVEEVNKHDY
jgi:toxin HigB-1